jgi:hypothetical protein
VCASHRVGGLRNEWWVGEGEDKGGEGEDKGGEGEDKGVEGEDKGGV